MIPVGIPVALRKLTGRAPVDDQVAARISVQPAQNVQKGRFAAAGRAEDRDEFVPAEFEVDALQRVDDGAAGCIVLDNGF